MFVVACGPRPTALIQFVPINSPPHAPTSRRPAEIDVFSSGPPQRSHTDVGLLYVNYPDGVVLGDTGSLAWLRYAAAMHGCDALVLRPPTYINPTTCLVYNDGREAP
jgi:hypothetical protein